MDQPASVSPHRPWLRYGVPVVAIVAIAWYALRGEAEDAPAPAKAPPAVSATLVKVAREDVPRFLIGVGNVQAAATVTVKARVDGQLEKVGYTEGQDVKAGQMIAQLDARPLQAQLAQVKAQKARDEAQLANAKLDLDRYTRLIKEDATTQQTLDTQRATVAQLQAAIQTDDAQIQYAQVQLGYMTITAPLSGRTGARLVDPGNIVHASDANGLVVINQIDPIAVVFTLPGDSVQSINHAAGGPSKLKVMAYAREGNTLLGEGHLVLVNNQIDTTSGTVQLKGMFTNPNHTLWPGQYVNVRLLLGDHEQATTVPADVLQRGPQGTYAYVVGPDRKAQMRPVEVVQTQDGKAVIGKGLQPGETVVLDGQYKIKPGITVQPARAAASAPALAGSVASTQGEQR
ncbi:MAG: efflux RND transporter periplasmic adaptor subunit [Proteobacteria bacterium]|nr:efflux RND transporter periplasmic adaptor subunit [Pseudomonadota bacterium]